MELLKETIVHGSPLSHGETSTFTSTLPLGESDPYSEAPVWAHWLSTAILSLTFIIGLPLNGATVLIFCRRKKLRHLVNFVLLLDCLSHIVLCLFCIPIHLVTVWSGSSFPSFQLSGNLAGLASLQQVIGNFVNLYSTFLTVSIAILRYRRLCWKKKDKFSTMNALKWSVSSGILALAVVFVQSYSYILPEGDRHVGVVYLVKIALILLALATVFFCYIRVSQRVWANTANQEKIMDPAKLKKSRSVHLKATIHSCVQIVLVVTTVTPHLYLQTIEMMSISTSGAGGDQMWGGVGGGTGGGGLPTTTVEVGEASQSQPVYSASQQQHLLNAHQEPAVDWLDSSMTFSKHSEPFSDLPGSGDGAFEKASNSTGGGSTASGGGNNSGEREQSLPVGIAAAAQLSTLGASHLAKLIAITINYALLAVGTPCAYIASCHRFREQFTSILFSNVGNSPQNSACPHHQHGGHHGQSSPNHKAHHHYRDRYYHPRSTTGATQDACFSSPLTRTDKTNTSVMRNHSSLVSRTSNGLASSSVMGNGSSSFVRESVSISISARDNTPSFSSNSRSSFSHSFRSRSSMRKSSVCGSSMKRRKSSGAGVISSTTGKGLLGMSIAADSVFLEPESALILESEPEEGSSSNGNLKMMIRCPTPSPSPTGGDDEVSARGSSSGELLLLKSNSNNNHHHQESHLTPHSHPKPPPPPPLPHTAVTTITSNSSNLHTYLQSYGGDCECRTDLGQLV